MNISEKELSKRTRRSFLAGGIAAAAGYGAYRWIGSGGEEGDIPPVLRRALEADDAVSHIMFKDTRLAPVFSSAEIGTARPNGEIGLDGDPDPDWTLTVEGASVSLEQIKAMPKVEQIVQFKCIEGWNYIMKWSGVRFSDFAAKYAPAASAKAWVAMETPDGAYYVGLDRASAMHPQTLLAYEMNGQPLNRDHGAPLRLLIPVKYGVKNLKRVGKVAFTDERPKDYWAENGYDYDSGF